MSSNLGRKVYQVEYFFNYKNGYQRILWSNLKKVLKSENNLEDERNPSEVRAADNQRETGGMFPT